MEKKNPVVFSAFDGMGCMQIALKEIGVTPRIYYASEIEKAPIELTMLNFPDTIQVGDIRDVDVTQLAPIDILAGGSPCQSFSFAGKRNGMSTACEIEITTLEQYLELKEQKFEFEGQSYLFWEYMRILTDIRKYNPNVIFLLENVKMTKKWERVLSNAIGVYGLHLDSKLLSAQNRKRIYWSNIKTKKDGLFGDLVSDIPQPKDRGILLKDILQDESEVDEKYYIKNPKIGFDGMDLNSKSNTLRTGGKASQSKKHNYDIIKIDKKGNIKSDQNKASCFTAGGNSGGNHSDMDIICVAMRGRNPENSSDRTTGAPTEQRLEAKTDGKTNYITSVAKDNLLIIPCDYRKDEGLRLKKDGKTGSLLARARNDESCGQLVIHDYRLRRLTPIECARLQTIPEWYDFGKVKDTNLYKALGNGWTIEPIKHQLQYLPEIFFNK